MRAPVAVQLALVVYSALFLHFFLVGSIDPLLPRLVDAHNLTSTQLSLILSAKSFTHMAISPVLAVASSRIQSEILFVFGVLAIGGAYVGMAISASFSGFVCARISQGCGIACIMVAGMSILVKAIPRDKRGKYISMAYSALGHSTLVAPLLSGITYDKLGQFWTFMIPGFAAFACTFVSAVVLSYTSRIVGLSRTESFAVNRLEPKNIIPALKAILSHPLAWVAYVGIYTDGMSFGSCEATLPQMLADWDGGLDVVNANLIWSVGPLTFTLMAPLVGMCVDKYGPPRVFISGLGFAFVLYPLFHLFSETLVGLGFTISLAFFVEAILECSIYPLVAILIDASQVPNAHPVGYSLTEMSIQGGFAIGSIVGRALYDWEGLLALGLFIGAWNALAFIGACAIYVRYEKSERLQRLAFSSAVTAVSSVSGSAQRRPTKIDSVSPEPQ